MFSKETASELRPYLEKCLSDPDGVLSTDCINNGMIGTIKHDIFNRFPEVYRRIFINSTLAFHLRLLLGDNFIILPETGIHKNSFGGWHKDVDAQQSNGHTFHWG